MKLPYRLFLAFLLGAVIIVGSMITVMRVFVVRNFSDYVTRVELDRMDDVVAQLAAIHDADGGWDGLRKRPFRLHALMPRSGSHSSPDGRAFPSRPPPRRPDFPAGFPPNSPANPLMDHAFPPRPGEDRPPPGDGPGSPDGAGPRLCVFDADLRPVTGFPDSVEDFVRRPIPANGETVGWLGLRRIPHMANPLDLDYLRRQNLALLVVGALILALAAVLSLVVSRRLLRPIRQLADATRRLSERRFDTRIPVTGDDELGRLASDFNLMADTLDRYERQRRQWVSDIAHELRTPLAILRGEIEAVRDGIRQAGPEAIDSLHDEVMHLTRLVNDLQFLSLADAGHPGIRRDRVRPAAVAATVLRHFAPRMEAQAIQVHADLADIADVEITGDEDRLRQLMANLLENTLRYTSTPGELAVSGRLEEKRLFLMFEDSPPGVPDESLDRLFDRLYRVDKSRSRSLGGSGLGLAICREIARLHGGEIRAGHSRLGGLAVILELPSLAPPPEDGTEPPEEWALPVDSSD